MNNQWDGSPGLEPPFDPDPEVSVTERGPEHVLMDRICAGDPDAFRALLERYWLPLNRYATGVIKDADAAEDIVQNVFVRVWRQRSDWVPTGSVSAYLYTITRNLALNARRDRNAEMQRRERGGHRLLSSSESVPDREAAAQALREEVEAAIEALPERRREAFVLSRFHGLSYQEIADTMGVATQTVANQMRTALGELREALSDHFGDDQ